MLKQLSGSDKRIGLREGGGIGANRQVVFVHYQAAAGVELQKRRVAETATAINQMNATVLEIARNAGEAAAIAGNTRENAQTGAAVVQKAGDSMAKVEA